MASRLRNDLNRLIYHFDADDPWKHFRTGAPHNSSVERGRRKKYFKLQKTYLNKNRKALRRKNGAYSQIATLNLVCCDQGCLLKLGIPAARQLIGQQRVKIFSQSYNDQNHVFLKLIDVSFSPSGRRTIRYNIPGVGKVCKTAFLKCYGISQRKVKVLITKIDPSGVCVEADKRGRHRNNPRKLLPEARRRVTNYISSHNATESHYRRSRTNKKYFESKLTLRKMWQEFVRKNPDFKANRTRYTNKGPVISYSRFRNIFQEELRDTLSFRKPRVDTCQTC